jgi:hypothetical protein
MPLEVVVVMLGLVVMVVVALVVVALVHVGAVKMVVRQLEVAVVAALRTMEQAAMVAVGLLSSLTRIQLNADQGAL